MLKSIFKLIPIGNSSSNKNMETGKWLKEQLQGLELNLSKTESEYLLDISESVCDKEFAEEIVKDAKLNAKSFMKTFQKRLQQHDEKEERVSISLKPFDEKNQEIFANSLKSSLSKINIERIQNHSITNGFNEPVHQFKMNNINTEFDVEIPKVKKEIDGDMKSNSHTVKYDGNNFAQTENIPK